MSGLSSGCCRSCAAPLSRTFVNLGRTPLANSLLPPEMASQPEIHYPLHVLVCERCFLVQTADFVSPENIFSHYVYFSSMSQSWLDHCRKHCDAMIARLGLGPASRVIEVASNDGYMLRNFIAAGIPALGIEPAANVAEVARKSGVPTEVAFFGRDVARRVAAQSGRANLIVANNVLAHVPDLNDFIAGFAELLLPEGVATIEFPYLLNLINESQFDTIYHEHFSYFSLLALEPAFRRHGLAVADAEQLPTHGGSLRLYVARQGAKRWTEATRVAALRQLEQEAGLGGIGVYDGFAAKAEQVKLGLLEFLVAARRRGQTVAGFGAAAKGNTLLNFCGIKPDLLPVIADSSPHKQDMILPGSAIPVVRPDAIYDIKPDFLLILPWNIRAEIMVLMKGIREWGGRFVVAVPQLEMLA